MDHLFITNKLDENDDSKTVNDLIKKISNGLLTADMRAAGLAGCRFEVEVTQHGKDVTFTMRTIEKVSILKAPDGTPVSVIVKR